MSTQSVSSSAHHRFAVGAMNFGSRTAEPEARAIIARALDCGILDFDTANAYSDGESERIVGRALAKTPHARIATKVGLLRVAGKSEGLAPERVLESVRKSRDRLQRDTIDLLYLHAPDSRVPVDETLAAIKTLLDEGTIARFGVSNFSSWQCLEIIHLCRARVIAEPVASQVIYNALIRQIEIEHLAFASRYGVKIVVYNPLAGGLLSGRYRKGIPVPKDARLAENRVYKNRYGSSRLLDVVAALQTMATSEGLSLVELSYAWLLARPGVHQVLIGPGTVAHLDEALAAATKILTPQTQERIAALLLAESGTDAAYAR